MVRFDAVTEAVRVSVEPVYLDEPSDVFARRFVFAYFVTIANDGDEPIQVLRRRWHIHDGAMAPKEIEGPGVVGKQPVIEPGESHRYNSFCVLETMRGSMEGTYLVERPSGERFRIAIPRFPLHAAAN